MLKRFLGLAACVVALSSMAMAQDAKTVIDNATKAMGSLKTVEYSGSGFDFAIGQNVNPTSAWPKFIDKTYKRTMNFETPAYRMERIRRSDTRCQWPVIRQCAMPEAAMGKTLGRQCQHRRHCVGHYTRPQ